MPEPKWILAVAAISAVATVLILRLQYTDGTIGNTVSKLTGRM